MYVMEIGCLLLSVLGVVGALKGKRWCLILVRKAASNLHVTTVNFKNQHVYSVFIRLHAVCHRHGSRQSDHHHQNSAELPGRLPGLFPFFCGKFDHKLLHTGLFSPQKRVVREETKLLSMMPLTATNKANRTLLYSIQQEVSESNG